MKKTRRSTDRKASKRDAAKKKSKWPIYFDTGSSAMVVLSLKPLRTYHFSHS